VTQDPVSASLCQPPWWRHYELLYPESKSGMPPCKQKKTKSYASYLAHGAALIFDLLALSQTPTEAARTRGQCVAGCARLLPSLRWFQILLFGDRGTCMQKTCPRWHSIAQRLGSNPRFLPCTNVKRTKSSRSVIWFPIKCQNPLYEVH